MSREYTTVAVVRIEDVIPTSPSNPEDEWRAMATRVSVVEGAEPALNLLLGHAEIPNCRERRPAPRAGEYWVAYMDGVGDLATRDIFLMLENDCGIALGHADLAIDAALADSDLAQALQVEEGAPIMRIERLTHTADGTPLDFEHLYYRGDAFQYRLRIDRHKGDQA